MQQILDIINSLDPPMLAAIALAGLATGFMVWAVLGIVFAKRKDRDNLDSMERKRIQQLRDNYITFRLFEPLVRELEPINAAVMSPSQQDLIALELNVASANTPWKPTEYYAVKQAESFLLGLVLFALLAIFLPVVIAALAAMMVAAINLALAIMAIPQSASSRRRQFKRRLPHAVDIMALLLQAGANFNDAIKVVAKEDRGNALGDEFARIKQQLDLNRTQVESLNGLKDRIRDEDTSDLIRAICKGVELGTPMSTILQTQADQMRLKRSQWGEKAAKEAEVKMTGPNLLIMLACIIVIMGPILLPIVYGGGLGFE